MFDGILDPAGLPARAADAGARRMPALVGARVGLLHTTEPNGAQLLVEIGRLLEARYGAVMTARRIKYDTYLPLEEHELKEIAAVSDVVITGVGDCDSCTASVAADGIAFERAGVPAAVICADAFEPTARAMAGAYGHENFTFLLTPHPVGALDPQQLAERAAGLVTEVVARLCQATR